MTTTEIGLTAGFDPSGGLSPRTVRAGAVDLAILEAGVGGRPLMLVHGFTGCKEDFGVEVVRFGGLGFHAVSPDHRGHGDSEHPEPEHAYTFETFSEDLLTLADTLGWERFDLLGHSMGGMIAQHLVTAHPHRVDRLVLMDTHHGPVRGLDPELIELGIELARSEGLAVIQQIVKTGADPLANPAYRRLCAEVPGYEKWCDDKFMACSPAMFASMLPRFHDAPDRIEALRGLPHPTLVLVGELDEGFLAASESMSEAIPDARLAVIPGAGHCPQMEATAEWRAAVDGFLLAGR